MRNRRQPKFSDSNTIDNTTYFRTGWTPGEHSSTQYEVALHRRRDCAVFVASARTKYSDNTYTVDMSEPMPHLWRHVIRKGITRCAEEVLDKWKGGDSN